MSLRSEVERIKSILNQPQPAPSAPLMIRVRGGVAGSPLHATVGQLHVTAQPTEDEDAFIARCFGIAAREHEQFIVLGGLLLGES